MHTKPNDLLELIDKIEDLGNFQDRIDSPFNLSQIWQTFLADICNLIDIDVCALFLVAEDTQEFALKYVTPEDQGAICREEVAVQIECGIFSWIINRRQPALIPALVFKNQKSLVMLPLATMKKTLGVACVLTSIKESFITHETLKLLAILAKQCSLVIENTFLYEGLKKKHESLEKANGEIRILSITDALTGCYNRGYLNQHLPQEIKRSLRYRHPLAVALCDIDHFKKVNDTYGHLCGDMVLKRFVQRIAQVVRQDTDWLARYGGEEFLLVLPETGVQNACVLAERLRNRVSQEEIATEEGPISITASFGVTGFDSVDGSAGISAEAMINAADRYLYQAKKAGRNKVVGGSFLDV
ncbi:MAG: sensor domain-containing diguanylate cyclase [Desulfobacterales bacterium]|nr:MAG: sensor domain-containing diguanylate cyclase [Desulfobacterales bacterium]